MKTQLQLCRLPFSLPPVFVRSILEISLASMNILYKLTSARLLAVTVHRLFLALRIAHGVILWR